MPSKIDHYTCTKTLGSGISAKVKLATAGDGTRVALKIFDKNNAQNTAKAMETLKHEVEVYQRCDHPYMVRLHEFKEHAVWQKSDGRQIQVAYMALELISGGELFDYVALKPFGVNTCRYYFRQMLQVMHFMHIKGISHRDLKPENIMLDDKFNVRFADFGFAAPMAGRDGSGFLKTILGTTAYMAPELILKQQYQGHSVDLFALGIILFILYSGHPPFNSAHPNDPHYKLLAEGKADLFWNQHSRNKPTGFWSEEFKDLITNMLQFQPTARLSLADIVGHPWMQGPEATADQVRAEFAQRQAKIKSQQAKEAAAKANTPKPQTAGTKREVRRGEDLFENQDSDLPLLKSFNQKDVFAQDNIFYSSYQPKDVMSALKARLADADIKPELVENKFKLTYEQFEEQSEQDQKLELPQRGARIQVKITEVDEEKVAIEFIKVQGDYFFFRDCFNEMKGKLSDFNNAVIDESLLKDDVQEEEEVKTE